MIIGIIGAMDSEMANLIEGLENKNTKTLFIMSLTPLYLKKYLNGFIIQEMIKNEIYKMEKLIYNMLCLSFINNPRAYSMEQPT